jgi:hypothetical protein
MQPGGPAFGEGEQRRAIGWAELQSHGRREEAIGLVRGEPEIGQPASSARAQLRQSQRWVLARGEHNVKVSWCRFDQALHGSMHGR